MHMQARAVDQLAGDAAVTFHVDRKGDVVVLLSRNASVDEIAEDATEVAPAVAEVYRGDNAR